MFPTGQRVTRIFDGATGTVEQSSIYDGRPLYGVRLDKDGEIWQGNDLAWRAPIVTGRLRFILAQRGEDSRIRVTY